ncbi:MAG TPA: hypothetical protein VMV53_05425 [Acidimicrobiales bacterium]|nr:hypothetical protein [Acidimicrobiales bacterium]
MAAVESSTKVVVRGTRGGPNVATLRNDRWWVQPVITVAVLTAFIIYSTWAAFQNRYYYVGASVNRDLISPFYSPCLANSCVPGSSHGFILSFWNLSPALIILIFPLGFRFTCYYYRRSYYRAFWWSPPACAVADAHATYSGETRFPLLMQNMHRYFFYAGLVFNTILTYDAIRAFRQPGLGWGVTIGTLVLSLNALLLWMYSVSCHACRHLFGGHVKSFKKHPIRHFFWKVMTPLNAKHMNLAWTSLIFVALTDVYVRLVASGALTDYKLF